MASTTQSSRIAADLRTKAERVNQLVRDASLMSKKASVALNDLAIVTSTLDKELMALIASLSIVDPTGQGVTELKHLRTINGINTRVARGLAGNAGRMKDIHTNSLIIS